MTKIYLARIKNIEETAKSSVVLADRNKSEMDKLVEKDAKRNNEIDKL